MSRWGTADPTSDNFLNKEMLLNALLKFYLASNTKTVLAVAPVDVDGNQVLPIGAAGSVANGLQTVTTAGTAVKLSATSIPCQRVFVQASSTAGNICVGASDVDETEATRKGLLLFSTQGDWFNVSDVSLLYVDASVNGKKCNWMAEV